MLQHIILLCLSLLLTACWPEPEESTSPSCSYAKPSSVPTYRWSEYPNQLNIKIDQEKLVTFMSLATTESECYLLVEDKTTLTQIQGLNSPNPEFSTFPSATESTNQNWKAYEDEFKNGMMGLTTIRFTPGKSESITETQITIREDAHLWHLWHEYSHVLIGESRAENPLQNLLIPSDKYLEKKLNQLQDIAPETDLYAASLSQLIQGIRDHIDKSYIDEMLIEATLIELVSQQSQTLKVTNEDWFQTLQAIDFFMSRYEIYFNTTQDRLMDLWQKNATIPQNQMAIKQALRVLEDQHQTILNITTDAKSLVTFQ